MMADKPTQEQIEDLQVTLMACVIALGTLPTGSMSWEQFRTAREAAYTLVWNSIPAGDADPADQSGMSAGWAQMGEDVFQKPNSKWWDHSYSIISRLLGMHPRDYRKGRS